MEILHDLNIADFMVKTALIQKQFITNLELQQYVFFYNANTLIETGISPFKEPLFMVQSGSCHKSIKDAYAKFPINNVQPHYTSIDHNKNEWQKHEFNENSLSYIEKENIKKIVIKLTKLNPFDIAHEIQNLPEYKEQKQIIDNVFNPNLTFTNNRIREFYQVNKIKQL